VGLTPAGVDDGAINVGVLGRENILERETKFKKEKKGGLH